MNFILIILSFPAAKAVVSLENSINQNRIKSF